MESLVHRISLEYRCTNPFQGKRKVANHEDEKSCVNFTDLEVDLQRPIEIQGNLGESPFKRLYYQTCGWCSCLCHSDFNLGPSSCHYDGDEDFFCRPWVTPLGYVHRERAAITVSSSKNIWWHRTYLLSS